MAAPPLADLCGDRWLGGNTAVTCQLDQHDRDIRHRATVTKREEINYGTSLVISEVTDTVEWEDAMIAVTRALNRSRGKHDPA